MVRPTQPETLTICGLTTIYPAAVLLRHLQPFLAPAPCSSFMVHHPAVTAPQHGGATIAVTPLPDSIRNAGGSQPRLVVHPRGVISVGGVWLTKGSADPTL